MLAGIIEVQPGSAIVWLEGEGWNQQVEAEIDLDEGFFFAIGSVYIPISGLKISNTELTAFVEAHVSEIELAINTRLTEHYLNEKLNHFYEE